MNVYMGYACADITPEEQAEMIGFARPDNLSKGILHRLEASVMVLKSTEETCCLVTIDSLGFPAELSNLLRQKIGAKLCTPPEKVMLCFSHTHSAPNAGTEDGTYYQLACEKILTAVSEAVSVMNPIKAAWGLGSGEIGVNRRGDTASVDNRIGILKVVDSDSGTLKLLLLRVTAHANVLSSDNDLISADYFGVTRKLLKEKYGCEVMMTQGAAGDIRPRYQQDNAAFLEIHAWEEPHKKYTEAEKKKYFDQSRDALRKMADSIDRAVDSIIDDMIPQSITRLAMFSMHSSFAADVPSLKRAAEIAQEAAQMAGIDGTGWLKEVQRLQGLHIKKQFADVEIQYFCINDGCLCGAANETMCRMALDVTDKAGNPLLLFGGYTNGCSSYLPTAEEYDKGGYEVLWSNLIYYSYHGRVMPLNRDTADRLVAAVVQGWKQFLYRGEIEK